MAIIEKDLNPDIYIGIRLPLDHNHDGFFPRTQTSLEQAKYNIKNLLLTQKSERLGNPRFGSDLYKVLFEQEGDDIESKVEEAIRSAMSEWLPFINIEGIETSFSPTNKSVVNVSIRFTMNFDTATVKQLSLNFSDYAVDAASSANFT